MARGGSGVNIEIQGIEGVENWLLMSERALYGATKHGVWLAAKEIKDSTISNLNSSPFKSDRLRLGVKHYFDNNNLAGAVDILGSKYYYNSYKLRFFEGGTKLRRSKHGRTYGSIRSNFFFKNAILANTSRAYQIVRNVIYQKIDELNKS